jgi:hypothetical protein
MAKNMWQREAERIAAENKAAGHVYGDERRAQERRAALDAKIAAANAVSAPVAPAPVAAPAAVDSRLAAALVRGGATVPGYRLPTYGGPEPLTQYEQDYENE